MTAPDASKRETRIEDLKALLQVQDRGIVSRILVKSGGGSVTLFAFDRGEGLSEHTAPFDAFLVGIEGEAEVSIGSEIHRLGEGQCLLIPASAPHAVNPITPFKMLLVMIRSGERGG